MRVPRKITANAFRSSQSASIDGARAMLTAMVQPPEMIDGARVLFWADSGTTPFGTMYYTDGQPCCEVWGFAICRYDADPRIYRFSCDTNWA
jgi:hypothetical protein